MRTEAEIQKVLDAWKKNPRMDSINLKENKELAAGREVIRMLEWILEHRDHTIPDDAEIRTPEMEGAPGFAHTYRD